MSQGYESDGVICTKGDTGQRDYRIGNKDESWDVLAMSQYDKEYKGESVIVQIEGR